MSHRRLSCAPADAGDLRLAAQSRPAPTHRSIGITLFVVLTSLCAAQERSALPADTLALIGNSAVTARDLIERFQLMPWPGKDRAGDLDSARIRALQSLTAERILALEAMAQGIGEDSTSRLHAKNLEKLMVRDELYKQEVLQNATASQKDISLGMKRSAREITVLMIGAHDRDGAAKLSRLLRSGRRLDSLLAHPPGGGPLSTDTVVVTFGRFERKQEDAVYGLTDSVRASEPVETQYLGWVVLYLLRWRTDPEYAKRPIPQRVESVARIVRKRNEAELAGRFSAELLSKHKAEARPEAFSQLARTLHRILSSDSLRFRNQNGYRLDRVVGIAEDSLAPHLHEILVDLPGGGLTIGDVLESYRTFDFLLPSLAWNDFRSRLNASIREVVAAEFLAREGYRRGLGDSENVRHDVDTWTNYWRARALMSRLVGDVTVTNDEVVSYLQRQVAIVGHDYEVNVREILTDSLHEALRLMKRVVGAEDMKTLAREYSKRKEWAARDGESGYFPVAMHPEIGFRALDAGVGMLVSPVKVPEGYSLFSVLGARRVPGDTTIPYDSLKGVVRNELYAAKVQQRLNKFLVSAGERHTVTLYYDRLARTETPAINMVTRRFIGFGGSMMAVPMIYPLWQWVRETKGVEEVFP